LTVAARRPDKLDAAAQELAGKGYEVNVVAGGLGDEAIVQEVVRPTARSTAPGRARQQRRRGHRRGGRRPDREEDRHAARGQPAVGFLFYRESVDLLRAAGAEHKNALVVNTSSISGKSGEAWLSVY
jgi:NAD(P)-dependent dehydrogenase (short-subunit alcohol dehydrogenase family)